MKTALFFFFVLLMYATVAKAQQSFNSLNVKDLALPSESVSRALYLNGSGKVKSSTGVTSAELEFIGTLSSDAQTQINGKQSSLVDSSGLSLALSDETGSGFSVFGTSPNITTPTGIIKSDVGLGNVDNTSDANKPVSIATQSALNLKVDDTDIIDMAHGGSSKALTAVNGGVIYSDSDSMEVLAAGTSGQYLVSSGGSAPVWTTVSVGAPQVAVLRDEKTNGTAGGGFTSGSYQTRTLNTEVDPSSIVSLSSNQFTLNAGTYYLSASAPAHDVNTHKIKIRNTTDSTDTLTGSKTISNSTAGSNDNSVIEGIFTIAGTKTFELQHRCQTTRASDGFGQAASYSDTEVYSQITIIKL